MAWSFAIAMPAAITPLSRKRCAIFKQVYHCRKK
jgi:hypothetical protein